jgi:hypothetical protein
MTNADVENGQPFRCFFLKRNDIILPILNSRSARRSYSSEVEKCLPEKIVPKMCRKNPNPLKCSRIAINAKFPVQFWHNFDTFFAYFCTSFVLLLSQNLKSFYAISLRLRLDATIF